MYSIHRANNKFTWIASIAKREAIERTLETFKKETEVERVKFPKLQESRTAIDAFDRVKPSW